MNVPYIKKTQEILQNDGVTALFNSFIKYIIHKLDPNYAHRFKFHTQKNHLQNLLRYDVPPDPYSRIIIEPTSIDSRLRRENGSMVIPQAKHRGIGRIKRGDWDTSHKPIEDTSDGRGCIIKGFIQRYESDMDWEDTVYYNYILENYPGDKAEHGCLYKYAQDRMESNEMLYKKISKEGYQSHHRGEPIRSDASEPIESQLEVLVVIDRKGNIHLFGGYHRFSVARVLDMSIPAQVVCRHREWQEIRDKVYNKGLTKEFEHLYDHPDLQDLIS